MAKEFYDLRDKGPVDRELPVVVRRLRDTGNLAQSTADQVHQMQERVARAEEETQEVIREFHIRQDMWEA